MEYQHSPPNLKRNVRERWIIILVSTWLQILERGEQQDMLENFLRYAIKQS